MVEIERPKTLFGKIQYFPDEQHAISDFTREVGNMAVQIDPMRYFGQATDYPKIRTIRHPEVRVQRYKMHYEKAKQLLEKIGV
jgi:hypothetical protein